MEKSKINKKIAEIKIELQKIRDEVLKIYSIETEKRGDKKTTIHSLNGVIMTRNSLNHNFVDLVRHKDDTFEGHWNMWLKGLQKEKEELKIKQKNATKGYYTNGFDHILVTLLKHKVVQSHIYMTLEKNFYKKYDERIREKPIDDTWELWFGDTNIFWGLFISPVFQNSEWITDKSKIRKVKFEYWTIGHILSTGLINPDTNKIMNFVDFNDFIKFYENILRNVSNSKYEKEIYDKYIEYLKNSTDIDKEPLLIPEIRFGGKERKHKYRMDFTILNINTSKFIGFELSPSSSHMSISGIKTKNQKELNTDLSIKWEKEIEKRNNFYEKLDIITITFTDKDLQDMDKCFFKIKKYLYTGNKKNIDSKSILRDILS